MFHSGRSFRISRKCNQTHLIQKRRRKSDALETVVIRQDSLQHMTRFCSKHGLNTFWMLARHMWT